MKRPLHTPTTKRHTKKEKERRIDSTALTIIPNFPGAGDIRICLHVYTVNMSNYYHFPYRGNNFGYRRLFETFSVYNVVLLIICHLPSFTTPNTPIPSSSQQGYVNVKCKSLQTDKPAAATIHIP